MNPESTVYWSANEFKLSTTAHSLNLMNYNDDYSAKREFEGGWMITRYCNGKMIMMTQRREVEETIKLLKEVCGVEVTDDKK